MRSAGFPACGTSPSHRGAASDRVQHRAMSVAASGSGSAPGPAGAVRAGFAASAALSVPAALAAALLAGVAGYLVLPLTELPAPFPDHHQDAETLVFVLSFFAIVPLAAYLGPRLADRLAAGPNAAVASVTGPLLALALIGLTVAVKVSEHLPWGGGLDVMLLALLLWWALAAALVAAALRRPLPLLERAAPLEKTLWLVAGALALVAAVGLAALDSLDALPVALGLLATAALVAGYGRIELPRLPRGLGRGYDVAAALLIVVAVPNLVIFYPEDPSQAFLTQVIHFHQDFFLGPASHVVGGGAMLVDTLSQYGVGSIVFIAAWFELVGTSNGTLGILDGILSGLVFAAAYGVLRAAGVSRLLASAAMLVALIALVWGLLYPVGGLLQHGAIRFGMPMAVLVAVVAGLRWPRLEIPARAITLLFVGLSAIWALEAFGYTVLTFAALIAARAALLEPGGRRTWLLRRAAEGVAACFIAHLVFALATLAWAGELPDWGLYINTLREFLSGGIGDLTYDFSPWSPGLGAGALLVASAVATILLITRNRELAVRERTATVALAGSTAYGVALFSYLVNRSADHIIPYVCLPTLIAVVIWIALALRHPELVSGTARRAALALAGGLSTLLVAIAWSGAGERLSESAIAYLPPGGKSVGAAIDRLADPPGLSPGAGDAEALLDNNWPGEHEAAVLLEPDLGIEALARTGRINLIPLSDPWEDSFVPDARIDDVDAALADMRAGDLLLIDANARAAFEGYRRDPSADPFDLSTPQSVVPTGLAILQSYALKELSTRFRLRPVEAGPGGLEVVELVDAPNPPPAEPEG